MILAIANQKGGVGKTTTAQNLAAGLNNQRGKTLMVDLDPQTNLTFSAGVDPGSVSVTVADLLEKKAKAADAILQTAECDLIPGDYSLTDADIRFTATGREYLLSEALEPVRRRYKYIVIDCPPTIGILTINALAAANSVLIPLNANIYSLQGLRQLHTAIMNVKQYCNRKLKLDGLLLTRYRQANVSAEARATIEDFAKQLNTRLYKTVIREGVAVSESQAWRGSLFQTAPRANVTADYRAFIEEFLKED